MPEMIDCKKAGFFKPGNSSSDYIAPRFPSSVSKMKKCFKSNAYLNLKMFISIIVFNVCRERGNAYSSI